ncbi:hypothetical protein AHAS_Ahas17G0283400 [Arachis hypogaea]
MSRHWWMYAFDVSGKRLFVLNSLHTKSHDTSRMRLDAYAVPKDLPLIYLTRSIVLCLNFEYVSGEAH